MNVEPVSEAILKEVFEEINRRFPTDAECALALGKNEPVKCKHCGMRFTEKITTRSIKCLRCKEITHVTADTPQRNIKKARAHLTAVVLLGNGIIFSAASLARLTGIVNSSAQAILKRYAFTLTEHLSELNLKALASSFESVAVRRSKLSPAGEHPREEYRVEEAQQSSATDSQQRVIENLPELHKVVYDMTGSSKLHFDTLFTQLQERGMFVDSSVLLATLHDLCREKLLECTKLQWFSRTTTSASTQIVSVQLEPSIRNNIDLIQKVFRGVSKKYMQLYLTLAWVFIDRERWKEGTLKYYLSRSYYIPDREIEVYNSPELLSLCAALT